jgi:hypothetical protein
MPSQVLSEDACPRDDLNRQLRPSTDGATIFFSRSTHRPEPRLSNREPRHQIHISDIVETLLRFTPGLGQTVTVQPDGFIPLQEAGDFRIADLNVQLIALARLTRQPVERLCYESG